MLKIKLLDLLNEQAKPPKEDLNSGGAKPVNTPSPSNQHGAKPPKENLNGSGTNSVSKSKYWDVWNAVMKSQLIKTTDPNQMKTPSGVCTIWNTGRVLYRNYKGTMEITGPESFKINFDDGTVYDSNTPGNLFKPNKTNTNTNNTNNTNTDSSSSNTSTADMPANVKDFQDWVDKTHPGWATGYKNGIVNKGLVNEDDQKFHSGGYGNFGPRTKAAWVKFKDEYIKQGGKAVPLKTGGSGENSGGSSNTSNNPNPSGAQDNQDFQDKDTKGARPCDSHKFPIVYGCISNTVGNIKQALGLNPLNDNTYGGHLLDLLANSGEIAGLDGNAAQKYKKDHSFQITKDMYDTIMKNYGKIPSDGNVSSSTSIDNTNQTQQPTTEQYGVGDVLEGEVNGKKYKITITSVNSDGTYLADIDDGEGNVTKGKVDENKKLKVLDLLFEDDINKDGSNSGGNLLDAKGYQAILDFENSLGRVTDTGNGNFKPVGMGYKSISNMIQEQRIKTHIEKTIGLDNWFKISPLFRVQIYSYMFNSDSDQAGDKYRWLGGLAETIDPTFDRKSIIKGSSDQPKPETDKAIKIVKNAIETGKINSFYTSYINELDKQYKSIKDNNQSPQNDANYDLLWSKRPQYLERLYNGEKIGEVIKGVKKDVGSSDADKKSTNTAQKPDIVGTTNNYKSSDLIPTTDSLINEPKVGKGQTLKLNNGLLGPFKINKVIFKAPKKINETIRKTTSKILTETLIKQKTKKVLKSYFK